MIKLADLRYRIFAGSMWGLQAIGATPSAPYSAAKAALL
jgi:hypothetical protein